MNRVIRNATISTTPPTFNGGREFLDQATADLIDRARAEAFEQGRREGFTAGKAEVEGAVGRIDGALRSAVRDLAKLRAGEIEQVISVALEVAGFVVGQLPPDDGGALATRIRDALMGLDDEDLVIAIHPQDWDAVGELVRLPNGVSMTRDPSLRPGEARIVGRWATADLTRDAALQVAREALL